MMLGSKPRGVEFEKIYLRPEITPISEVNDIIRYTEIQSPENLESGMQGTLNDLENEGYQVLKMKNTCVEEYASYYGIKAKILAPNGQIFELQFHTPESFKFLHAIYGQVDC